jgi:hypothetical protein
MSTVISTNASRIVIGGANKIFFSNEREVVALQNINLTRLRDPASAEFNALKRALDTLVMQEQQRHHAGELMTAAVH